MFLSFFYLLRAHGLKISLNEWMTLLDALQRGLHRSSLTGFYRLCRAVLIKSEADFDRFDQVFSEFFGSVPAGNDEIPQEILYWLNHPYDNLLTDIERMRAVGFPEEDLQTLLDLLQQRLREQDSEHNGGSKWVGTGGTSPFGNSGWHPGGIRIEGEGHYRTAVKVAGERHYRDFRRDNQLDTRQFQLAFRTLRQLTEQNDSERTELDLDATVHSTCENAGVLHVQYKKPRKNAVKVLLLMDSGGSMEYYATLCSMLFQAAVKSNHFKELHTYYFHNIIDKRLYHDPALWEKRSSATQWVLDNFGPEYKVIIVGDAAMAPEELNIQYRDRRTSEIIRPGLNGFEQFRRQYPHLVWLNPEPEPNYVNYWTMTRKQLSELFPMFQLSAEGVEQAMRRLMTRTG